ncbi:MAG: YHYH protein [Flavobacteriales bacterium]|nr:YHYH protein [Flavobacteriales bacterium]
MKKTVLLALALTSAAAISAQEKSTNPAVTSWMINTTGLTGSHYVTGNSTPISDSYDANVQQVEYSNNYSYISASGIPAYTVGPYQDGNPSQATDNSFIFKIPLNPTENTGTLTETEMGTIGVFINGVSMYDYRDGVSYSLSSGADAGGPLGGNGDEVWNRDAIVAENEGFDCSKGHPSPIFSGGPPPQGTLSGGHYHHHQNPSAFNLDLVEVSDVCDLYVSDGLYVIDSTQHSPLLGYAFDGFPVYGPYGYANANGTGGIKRIQSSYQLRTNMTQRTHYYDGTDVTDGPDVSSTYPLGYYREDYEFNTSLGDLDEHNGRFCVTPEYPAGIYCYFATVDENWNSAFPYMVGPTYYGNKLGAEVTLITESTTVYNPATASVIDVENVQVNVFPNPASDLIAIQLMNSNTENFEVRLFDLQGKLISSTMIKQGSTIAYFDTKTIYSGQYIVEISNEISKTTKKITVQH